MAGKKADNMIWQASQAGVQLVAIILIFVFAGYKLDQKVETEKPWFTLGLSLFGVIIGMIWFIRTFTRLMNKEKKAKEADENK